VKTQNLQADREYIWRPIVLLAFVNWNRLLNPEAIHEPLLSAVTVDGHIVVEFPSAQQPVTQPGSKLLGYNEYGGAIVEYIPTILPYTKEELQAKVAALRQSTSGVSG
jgi:hypothetical protein